MKQSLDCESLYRALVERDRSYDGRAYVGVRSTGIFCRLSCSARKPRPENCQFFESPEDCLAAGFRPCLRCRPTQTVAALPASVQQLLSLVDSDPDRRWSEADIAGLGYDPSTIRRQFRRHLGRSFIALARTARLRRGTAQLANSGRVIDAQLSAGFESASGFRNAFTRLLGMPPAAAAGPASLFANWVDTPLGPMIAVCDDHALHLLEFADRRALPTEMRRLAKRCRNRIGIGRTRITDQITAELARYFAGALKQFSVPLALHGSPFTQSVWRQLLRIPSGESRSYAEIARAIGRPQAVRAVARANGANQLALVIPCHRVIGSDGSLVGYGGGLARKAKLLELERLRPEIRRGIATERDVMPRPGC